MKQLIFTISAIFALVVTSCQSSDPNRNVDEGNIEGKIYTCREIGWEVTIPDGWKIIDIEQTEATNQKGLDMLEETLDQEIDDSGLRNLISLKKNQFNIFQSTMEPFELEYEGEWEENNAFLKEILYDTYANQGIHTDSTITTIEKIDGVDFQTYTFTIYGPQGDVILNQIMYSSHINGLDFGVNINYNNDKDRDELLSMFRNSTFK